MKRLNNKKIIELINDEKIGYKFSKIILLLALLSIVEFVGIAFIWLAFFEFWKAICFSMITRNVLLCFNFHIVYVTWNFIFRNEPEMLKLWEEYE